MLKELLVARIISGSYRCKVYQNGKPLTLLLKAPTLEQRYLAEEVYQEVLTDSELDGALTDDELLVHLVSEGIWNTDKQNRFDGLIKDIEEIKVKLYQMTFRSNERKVIRAALDKAKLEVRQLQAERHSRDHLSCSGAAEMTRNRYLLGCSLYYATSGCPVFTSDTFWESSSTILDQAIAKYTKDRITEEDYREMARSEPWRSTWQCRKATGRVFDIPSTELSDEQKSLIVWSTVYDNIYEHPECPPDDILQDDDILDGWMIIQKRKRQGAADKRKAEELIGNKKIREAEEVYIVANSSDDAKKIETLNDDAASIIKAQRMAHLKKAGEVRELDMPDTRQRFNQEMVKHFGEVIKGGKING